MSYSDELTGTLVLVHPELVNDPAKMQNRIGMITGVDIDRDDIYVSFGNGPMALYGSDALLVLRPVNAIYTDLMSQRQHLEPADFKTLFQITLLQDYSQSPTNQKTAMELATRNDTVSKHSLVTLKEAMQMSPNQYLQR